MPRPTSPLPPGSERSMTEAVEQLRRGGLVAFPTETVYGLGADASNPEAVARIFVAKGRPADHPLIVHLASAEQVDGWATDVPEVARRLAERFWPGPLTLILRKRPEVPDAVTGGQPTVGLRVPSHPVARALLSAFGGGVAAPSANRFGRVSPTTREHVVAELGDRVDVVLEGGASEIGIESTIVDLSGDRPRLLRPGGIGAAAIAEVVGVEPTRDTTAAPRTPGRLASHYAPATPVRVVERPGLADLIRAQTAAGRRVAVVTPSGSPVGDAGVVVVGVPTTPDAYAHDLYAHLAALDELAVDVVLVERPPVDAGWEAVHDRLGRAEGIDPHAPRVLAVVPDGASAGTTTGTTARTATDDVTARVSALLADLPGVVDLGVWRGTWPAHARGAHSADGAQGADSAHSAHSAHSALGAHSADGAHGADGDLVLPGRDRPIRLADVRTDGTVTVLVAEASDANRGIPVGRYELVEALERRAPGA